MLGVIRAVVDRVKALLVLKAAEELKAEAAAAAADRRAGLLDAAGRFDRAGQPGVAAGLRALVLRPAPEGPVPEAVGTGGGPLVPTARVPPVAGGRGDAGGADTPGGDKPAKRPR